jgi:aminopeptidase N
MSINKRIVGLALFCAAGAAWTTASVAAVKPPVREVLSDSVIPLHYELALEPDAETLTFRAKVAITLHVHVETSAITLNAVGLSFDHAVIDGGKEATVSTDEKLGRATLKLGAPLATGRHVLSIDYHGKIGRSTLGFFAMDYAGPDGPRRTLATNFEPAAARELLPCWDEPGRKATFTLSVDTPKDRMAISNMPVATVTELSATLQRVRFLETPKMSTYLLFIGVGDFERIHAMVDGVDVGVIVKRGDTAKAAYALDQAGKILHYYNDYFGVPFPLPKLDLIAAPGQISGGSMENWGAIFYSQNHLLFDPKVSTEEDRQLVFLVVAHEMAHQWFGDLVTMAWWSDLWLNEGFARWMQTFAADDLHSEWRTGLKALSIFEQGKEADAVPSTHAVVQKVYTAEQAAESFDAITYDKGASIITMLNAYVGRDKFREGVRRYMRAHAYGNTVDTDLWRLVEQAVGQPVVGIERDFTRQEGVPLVRVTVTGKELLATQARFAADPSTIDNLPPQHWRLPLAVAPIGGDGHYLLLQGTAHLPQAPLLIINAGQTSYARILYSDDVLAHLTAEMASLKPADQMGLLNDERALGIAGYASPTHMLRVAAMLPASADPIVWQRVLRVLEELELHYGDTPARAAFRGYALGLLAPLAAQIGPAGTPADDANIDILRGVLRETQGAFGDSAVIAAARKRLESGDGTAAEQRSALIIVAAQADAATFDALLARADRTADALEKMHIFRALAGVNDPALARRMLDVALGNQVPAGSAPSLIAILDREHPDLAWEVIAPRLDDPALPFEKTLRWAIAADIAGRSANPERITDLEAYEDRSVPPEARKPFLEAVASIRQNQRIASTVLPEIDRWIAARAFATAANAAAAAAAATAAAEAAASAVIPASH